MSALTVVSEDGLAGGGANPIYLVSDIDLRNGAQITFEVLEADASQLKKLVGTKGAFGIDAATNGIFFGELTSVVVTRWYTGTRSGFGSL